MCLCSCRDISRPNGAVFRHFYTEVADETSQGGHRSNVMSIVLPERLVMMVNAFDSDSLVGGSGVDQAQLTLIAVWLYLRRISNRCVDISRPNAHTHFCERLLEDNLSGPRTLSACDRAWTNCYGTEVPCGLLHSYEEGAR